MNERQVRMTATLAASDGPVIADGAEAFTLTLNDAGGAGLVTFGTDSDTARVSRVRDNGDGTYTVAAATTVTGLQ